MSLPSGYHLTNTRDCKKLMTATPSRDWLVNRLSLYKLGKDCLENIASISSVAYVSVAADTCLSSRCLAMTVSPGSINLSFRCHVTIWMRKPSTRPVRSKMRPRQRLWSAATTVTWIQQPFACWSSLILDEFSSANLLTTFTCATLPQPITFISWETCNCSGSEDGPGGSKHVRPHK
jgi:hypothetical protein